MRKMYQDDGDYCPACGRRHVPQRRATRRLGAPRMRESTFTMLQVVLGFFLLWLALVYAVNVGF